MHNAQFFFFVAMSFSLFEKLYTKFSYPLLHLCIADHKKENMKPFPATLGLTETNTWSNFRESKCSFS